MYPYICNVIAYLLMAPRRFKNFFSYPRIINIFLRGFLELLSFVVYALLFASIVLAILSVYNSSKNKNFNFVWVLLTAFLNIFLRMISLFINCAIYKISIMNYIIPYLVLTCVMLILLILDVIYLRMERKYFPETAEARQATKQAKREASRQAMEEIAAVNRQNRIRQLESELKRLKAMDETPDKKDDKEDQTV